MYICINGSVEPFFIALFDEEGQVRAHQSLKNDKTFGHQVFNFLEDQKSEFDKLKWVGGVSGPGGFATLRTVSSLVKSLAHRYEVGIKQVEAFDWIAPWVQEKGFQHYVLNSFGEKVFFDGELRLLKDVLEESNTWFGALPVSKREGKDDQVSPDPESLYKVLASQKEQQTFSPSYGFAAVETE